MWEADSELSMRDISYGDDILLPTALDELYGLPGLVCRITGHSKQEDGAVVYSIVTEYVDRIGDADAPSRPVAQMQQRYSAFRMLHACVRTPLNVHFKVAPHILRDVEWVKEERVVKLAAYVNECLRSAQARGMEPPEALRTFLGIDSLDKLGESSTPSTRTRLALGALLVLLLAAAWSRPSQPPVAALPGQATSVALVPQVILAQGARIVAARAAAVEELGQRLRGDLGGKLKRIKRAAGGGIRRSVRSVTSGITSTVDAAKARLRPKMAEATARRGGRGATTLFGPSQGKSSRVM